MNDTLIAKNVAGQYFKDGYNCAEAILRTFNDVLELKLDENTLKIASGFGGGVGHAGCMCGALTASTMVISLLTGRASAVESRDTVYRTSQEFHDLFVERFGGSCCRVLNPHPFESKDHLRNCLKITGRTADFLAEYLVNKIAVR